MTVGCWAERMVHRANKGSSEESAITQVDVCVGARLFRVSKNRTAVSTLNGTPRPALASGQTQVDRFQQSKQASANDGVNCRILPWIGQFERRRKAASDERQG